MFTRRCLAGVLLISVLPIVGCMVGPDYRAPRRAVPEGWTELDEGSTRPATVPTHEQADLRAWWKQFDDPVLNELMDRSLAGNFDLRLAVLRIEQARAERGIVAPDLLPFVGAGGALERSRSSENLRMSAGGLESTRVQTGLDVSWELDVFGRVRRAIEAADARVALAVEDRRAVMVSVLAEVAQNYLQLRSLQQRLDIAERTVRAQQQTLELTRSRFNAGLDSGLRVAQAEAQVARVASTIPPLEDQRNRTIRALGVLAGGNPDALRDLLLPTRGLPASPPAVRVGLPSELLLRRPDIRRAEAQLHAAVAEIGVATADLYPRFDLAGNVGLAASNVANLFEGRSVTWSVGPSFSWAILNWGRVRSNIGARDAQARQALVQWEQTVVNSIAEVENALSSYQREQSRRDALARAVDANRRAVELATQLYSRGLGDFLSVLDAERSLFASEDDLAVSQANVGISLVLLYRALGGGWDADLPSTRP